MFDNLDIIVLASQHKKNLTSYVLSEPHQVYVNQDWELPGNILYHNSAHDVCPPHKQESSYRCFRGHQEALKLVTKEFVLMLEDDALPKKHWQNTVRECFFLARKHKLVQLYGRDIYVGSKINHGDIVYYLLGPHPRKPFAHWMNGSVAYLCSAENAKVITEDVYTGLPMDIYLANRFNPAVLDVPNQPFDHTDVFGSHFDPETLRK